MRSSWAAVGGVAAAAVAALVWLWAPARSSVGLDPDAAGEGGDAAMDAAAGLDSGKTAKPVEEAAPPKGRGSVTGTVRRAGTPSPARIEVFVVGKTGDAVPEDWLTHGFSEDFPDGGVLSALPYATGAAGGDGRFTVGGLDPGTFEVVGVATDGARGAARVRISAEGIAVEAQIAIRWGPESLKGRTVKADGSPWKGHVAAQVVDWWSASTPHGIQYVETGDDGRFTIPGLERGRVSLVAIQDRSVRVVSRPLSVPYPGEYVFVVDADLHDLAGRVVEDRDARPLAGATVVASAWGLGDRSEVKTRAVSDVEGKFRLPVPVRGAEMTATAPGYAPAGRHVGEGQEQIEIRLVRAARVRGRVTSEADGTAVAGVGVYAVSLEEDVSAGARAVTGPDGRYEIPDAQPGTLMVCAFGGGWYTKALLEARPGGFNPMGYDVAPDGTLVVDLVVVKGAVATGKVTTSAGKPVPGATVVWTGSTPTDSSLYQFEWVQAASRTGTALDGTFTSDTLVPGQQYRFEAEAPGESAGSAGPFDADLGKPITVEIKLPAARWLDAEVVEAPREPPVPGATVFCWFQRLSGGNGTSAVTGADGKCRVGPLPEGRFWAMAHGPGFDGSWNEMRGGEADSKQEILTQKFVVTRGHDIRLRLRYSDGTVVGDRQVYLQLTGPNANWSQSGTPSDGIFEFDGVSDGTYRIEIRLEQDKPAVAGVTVQAGDEETVVTVPGGPAPRFTLVVLDPAGKPVPFSKLLVSGFDEGDSPGVAYEGRVKLPAVASDGWIEVYAPATPGNRPAPFAPQTVGPIAEGTETKEVRLEGERRIEGRVHETDGSPLRGVRVRAMPLGRAKPFEGNDTPHDVSFTDVEGRFRLGRLWAGDYKLFVEAAGTYAPFDPLVVAAGSMTVDVTLSRGLVVALPVLDAQGRPVAKASVTASIEGRQSVRAIADAGGVARLAGLDRARAYALYVEPPGEGGDSLALSIEDWKPSEDAVRLPPAVGLRGVVRDREGRLVGGARITLSGPGGSSNSAQTGGDGAFAFPRLQPGEYRLFAVSQEGEKRRASPLVTVFAGAADLVLVLDPALELKVRIDGWPRGEGEAWAPLRIEGTNVVCEWARIGDDGVATFSSVHPASTYAIFMRPDFDLMRCVNRRGIRADAGEIRARLENARTISGRLVGPRGTTEFSVSVNEEGVALDGEVDAEGRYVLKGVPDGTWTVHARGTVDGASVTGSVEATAGANVDIELKPR